MKINITLHRRIMINDETKIMTIFSIKVFLIVLGSLMASCCCLCTFRGFLNAPQFRLFDWRRREQHSLLSAGTVNRPGAAVGEKTSLWALEGAQFDVKMSLLAVLVLLGTGLTVSSGEFEFLTRFLSLCWKRK